MRKNIKKTTEKGFSLVEVLITVFILTFSFSAITLLMVSNIKNSREAKNQMIAAGLAQEGNELVRNVRDNNALDDPNDTLKGFFSGTFGSSFFCNMDVTDGTWDVSAKCGGTDNNDDDFYTLYYKNGFYSHNNTGEKSRFARRIFIMPQKNNGDAAASLAETSRVLVGSVVTWDGYRMLSQCTIANKCLYVESVIAK